MIYRDKKNRSNSKFAAHRAVVERIAGDVAASCARSYYVQKTRGTSMRSSFTIFFFPREVKFDSDCRFAYCNYGMGEMKIEDLQEFRNYFRPILADKFRAELNKESGGRFDFTLENEFRDHMFDAKWALKVTVWFTQSGLTAW